MTIKTINAVLLCAGVCALACAAAGTVRGQPHKLVAVYRQVIETGRSAVKWNEAEKGDLAGTMKFSGRRPNQSLLVYLTADDGEGEFTAPGALKVRQKGAKFDPAFAVLMRGQKAEFINDETAEIDHNVYFLGAEDLDLGIFEPNTSVSHEFTKAGEVSVHCSIHKLMDAKFFVAPSPAFVEVKADDTSFSITGIPAGKYTLRTYQRTKRFKDAEIAVEIKKGEKTSVTVGMTR